MQIDHLIQGSIHNANMTALKGHPCLTPEETNNLRYLLPLIQIYFKFEPCLQRSYRDTAADCLAQGLSFIPMVAEPSGGWGPSGLCTLKALARAEALCSGRESGVVFAGYLQRLCVAIRKSNARAVLRRQADVGPPSLSLAEAVAVEAADAS